MKIELGQKARDLVTGFEGVAVARTEWLNGCVRITLQAPVDKDGKVPDTVTFDDQQLMLVEDSRHVPKRDTGGPRPEPRRAADPR